jgi:acyl carrier protein
VRQSTPPETADGPRVAALYGQVLGRDDVTSGSTFASLGGDSLSYVEVSVALEERLGHLPARWHTRTVAQLERSVQARRRRLRTVDSTILLRATAILFIVGSHAGLYEIVGGAHLLVAVAGFNFARFQLSAAPRLQRVRNIATAAARVSVPAIVWITALFVLTGQYTVANTLLLNEFVGPHQLGPPWQFWFLEALLHILLALTGLAAIPAWDQIERRRPFVVACGIVAVGLTTRYGLIELWEGPHRLQSAPAVLWLFGLGWAAAKVTTKTQRALVTLPTVLVTPGFFGDPQREAIVAGAVLVLAWVQQVSVPRVARAAASVLASSSLYIYLTHWQIFPHLEEISPPLAVLASVVVGVVYWQIVRAAQQSLAWRPQWQRSMTRQRATWDDHKLFDEVRGQVVRAPMEAAVTPACPPAGDGAAGALADANHHRHLLARHAGAGPGSDGHGRNAMESGPQRHRRALSDRREQPFGTSPG